MPAHTVLVTDAEQRSALAAVRSLGRAGHRVVVCAARSRPLAAASRYAAACARVADPLRDPERFVADVGEVVRARGADTVLGMTEPSLLAILAAPDALHGARVPVPPLPTFRRISDKAELLAVAPEVGIAVPEQRVVPTRADVDALLAEPPPLPVVLKPARSVGEHGGQRAKLAVRHAASIPELEQAVRGMGAEAFPLLVQQRVVGPGVGIFLLEWHGETLAVFSHRRIREKPPSGGVSVYRESIPADPALVARSRALLERFAWCGVAMIEYKVDAASNTPYLMEVNGRFWGSLQLAVDAGVDFPALLLAAAWGEPVSPVTSYRAGVRSRWWWGDVDHLVTRLRRSRASLALPPDAPGRLGALRDFLTVRTGDRREILRFDDPRPFVRESAQWLLRR